MKLILLFFVESHKIRMSTANSVFCSCWVLISSQWTVAGGRRDEFMPFLIACLWKWTQQIKPKFELALLSIYPTHCWIVVVFAYQNILGKEIQIVWVKNEIFPFFRITNKNANPHRSLRWKDLPCYSYLLDLSSQNFYFLYLNN